MDREEAKLPDGLVALMAAILEDAAHLAVHASPGIEQVEELRRAGRDVEALGIVLEVIRRRAGDNRPPLASG